jgi:hypothetical protein
MKIKTQILVFLLLAITSQGFSQQLNQKTMDEKKHCEILIGQCNRDGFATCNFDSAYKVGYSAYAPDRIILDQIASIPEDITIILAMGTWCGDSKEHVPHFYKVLDLLKFNLDKLTLICVDRSKTAPGIDLSKLNIQRVPTFIFFRKNKEIGRIVETPEATLEKDILRIISGN